MAADHDHRQIGIVRDQVLEHAHAVHVASLQPNVEQDETRQAAADLCQRTLRVPGLAGLLALVGKYAGDRRANIPLVVDD